MIFHGNQPDNKPGNGNLFGKQDSTQAPSLSLPAWWVAHAFITGDTYPPMHHVERGQIISLLPNT